MMRGRAAAVVVALALSAACSSSAGEGPVAPTTSSGASDGATASSSPHASGPSAGCTLKPAVAPGTADMHLVSRGVDRVYQVVVPSTYDGTRPFAVVLGLHALTVSYTYVPSITGFADMAPAYDFIGVAPSGRLNGNTPFWNAAPVPDNYDVAFISELLDRLEATLCVDTAQVFSTGMSNGAQMSALLACRLPDRITAIAPVAGVEFLPPCDGASVPIIAFHGTGDPILPYTGGGLNATTIADTEYYKGTLPPGLPAPLGVDESMRKWAEHNRCDVSYVEDLVATHVRRRTWQNCAAPTELYVVDGGGHAWPGKPVPAFEAQFGPGTTEIDATTLMFAFFFDR